MRKGSFQKGDASERGLARGRTWKVKNLRKAKASGFTVKRKACRR
jgi:hypothetical protein